MHRLGREELLDDGVDARGVVGQGAEDAVLDVAEGRLGLDRDPGVRAVPVGEPVVVRQVGGRRRKATWARPSARWPSGESGARAGYVPRPPTRPAAPRAGVRRTARRPRAPSVHTETTQVSALVEGLEAEHRLGDVLVVEVHLQPARPGRSERMAQGRGEQCVGLGFHRARTSFTRRTLGRRDQSGSRQSSMAERLARRGSGSRCSGTSTRSAPARGVAGRLRARRRCTARWS